MRNAIKLTIDKEEYVTNTQDVNLTVSNLSSLEVKNLYLTSDERDRYPVKSVNGDVVTIDSTIIANNTSKTFMLCGEKTLPKFEFLNMPRIWTINEMFELNIKRGAWTNSIPSSTRYLDIEVFLADDNTSLFARETDLMDYVSNSSLTSFRIENFYTNSEDIEIKEEINLIFRLYSEDSSGKRTYYAESNVHTIQLNGSEIVGSISTPIYTNMDAMIFEAGKSYSIPFNSNKEDTLNLYGYIGIRPLNSTLSGHSWSKVLEVEISDRVNAKFIAPDLSGIIEDRAECSIQLYLSERLITGTNLSNHIARSKAYRCIYVNNINNKHSLV